MTARRNYSFGEYTLDLRRGTLLRAATEVPLRPKSFSVLRFLVERHGQLVTKDELLDGVWGRTVVTEGSITQCLLDVRRAIGDDAQSIVRTVPKRGYIFDAPVIESDVVADGASYTHAAASVAAESPEPRRTPSRRRLVLAATCSAAALLALATMLARHAGGDRVPQAPAGRLSIAVLPFADMSPGKDQQYLADGIAEEILDRLAGIGTLRVIARTSSFSMRDQPLDVPTIAKRLGVTHVLEGSVRKSGERFRVTVQLVDTANNSHLWSKTFERPAGDLFSIQDEIAGAVASSLQATISRGATTDSAPASIEAYERFLQGRFFFNRRAPGDVERARKYLEESVAIDPGFVRSWVLLSGVYSTLAWDSDRTANWRSRQGEAARRAVELDPNSVRARTRLAEYYYDTGNLDAALEQFRAAEAADPTSPRPSRYANGFPSWGNETVESLIAEARSRVATDPLSPTARFDLGLTLFAANQLDQALSEFNKSLELNPQQDTQAALEIARVLVAQQRFDQAYSAIMRLPDDLRDYGVALLADAPGRRADADAALARLTARTGDYMHCLRVSEIHVRRGRYDDAFDWLQRARDGLPRDEALQARIWWLQNEMFQSPFLTPLHSDPRWSALMETPGNR